YETSAREQIQSLRETSASASELSDQILINGVLVATERSTIRDLIAEFVTGLIESALEAAALAVPSGGSSVAGFVGKRVLEAVHLARTLPQRVARLLRKLSEAAERLAKLAERVNKVAAGPMRAAAAKLSGAAEATERRVGELGSTVTQPAIKPRDLAE